MGSGSCFLHQWGIWLGEWHPVIFFPSPPFVLTVWEIAAAVQCALGQGHSASCMSHKQTPELHLPLSFPAVFPSSAPLAQQQALSPGAVTPRTASGALRAAHAGC